MRRAYGRRLDGTALIRYRSAPEVLHADRWTLIGWSLLGSTLFWRVGGVGRVRARLGCNPVLRPT